MYAGIAISTGFTATAGKWGWTASYFNGAASRAGFNESVSGLINPGTSSLSGVSLFNQNSGNFVPVGMHLAYFMWTGTIPTMKQINDYLSARFGRFPQ
jgi:hypothetical protein